MGYVRPKADVLRQGWEKRKQDNKKPVLLTVPEVCDCLRVSRYTIYRLLNQRKLASVHVLKRRLVPLEALEDFLSREAEGAL